MDEESAAPTPESDLAFARKLVADDRILTRLLAYWRAKAPPGRLPARADIDPADIPDLLGHLMMVEGAGESFRCRLCGTAIAEAYGRELTGKTFAEAFASEGAARAAHHCRLACEQGRPVVAHSAYRNARDTPLVATRLLLPLADDGSGLRKILVGFRSNFAPRLRAPAGNDPAATLAFGRELVVVLEPAP